MITFYLRKRILRKFYNLSSKYKFESISTRVPIIKLLIVPLIILIIVLCYFLFAPVPNCYFDKIWNDGMTLHEISDTNLLKAHQSSSDNVFFHETSCIEDGIIRLNARQACAIESTALTNPDHKIFVLFTSQVGFRNQTKLPIIDALLSYPNVHINYLNLTKYAENTPLEDWVKTKKLFKSRYVISHTSDVLRFLSLWKYGGTYLDLDVVMLKSLNTQKPHNFASAESDWVVAVGIIHLEGQSGHEIADMCVKDLRDNFSGTEWANNGPMVLTRVLYEICGTEDVDKMIYNNPCRNFKVLSTKMCYDVGWAELKKFFREEYLNETLFRVSDSLMTHVWNKDSARIPLNKNDNVAYIHLARKYCPKTLNACDTF